MPRNMLQNMPQNMPEDLPQALLPRPIGRTLQPPATTAQRRPALFGALALLALLVPGLASVRAEILEDRALNYEMEIPHGWVRLPETSSWKERGIVVGAIRELVKRKDGSPSQGEGAMVHLAITPAPAGKTIDDLKMDETIRGFLLSRFGEDPAAWPEVEIAADSDPDTGLEYRVLTATGKAPNLKAKPGPVRAVMLLTVVKGRLYQLRMYAWHTEFDAEGLKDDLDVIEMNFTNPDTSDAPREEGEGERPPPSEDEEDDAPKGDEAEEVPYANRVMGWKFTKPVGLLSTEIDEDKYPYVVAWLEDNHKVGWYRVTVTMMRRTGRNRDTNVLDWAFSSWWNTFHKDHADGPVETFPWPKRSKKFFVMPDLENPIVVFEEPRKRPAEADPNDQIKKLKILQRIKKQKIGKEKCLEAYRGSLRGNRERLGKEIVIRYVFGTAKVIGMIQISMTRDAPMKFAEPIAKLLESFELTTRR